MYHKDGGGGIQLNENPTSMKTIDPVSVPMARGLFLTPGPELGIYNAALPQYQLGTYDLRREKSLIFPSRYAVQHLRQHWAKIGIKYMAYGHSIWDKKPV